MAAVDHHDLAESSTGVSARRLALPSSAGELRAVRAPRWARAVLIQVTASDGSAGAGSILWHGVSEASDEEAIGNDVTVVDAGVGVETAIDGGGWIGIAGPAAGYAHVTWARRRT
jgi:hypothetical protein